MLDVGQIIGERYRIERLLGSGRFASVYAAEDNREKTTVAIKVFKPSMIKPTVVGKRFLKRTRSATVSPHPFVLPLLGSGLTPEGTPFLVMEYLDGRTVDIELQARGALSLPRSIHIIASMLEGLAAIHAEGSVHRNINPSNLFLVDPELDKPTVRILDYGVAQDLVDHLAVAPAEIGSTRYLAPEILLDPGRAWTPSLDVFAAGMVMFVMLTGRLPFDRGVYVGSNQNTIDAYKAIYNLPGPSTFAEHIPEIVDRVVCKAVAIKPSERYLNAQEMLDALESSRLLTDTAALAQAGDGPKRLLKSRVQWHGEHDPGDIGKIPAGIAEAFDDSTVESVPDSRIQVHNATPREISHDVSRAVHAFMDLFSPDYPPPPQADDDDHYEPTKALLVTEKEGTSGIEPDSDQTEIDGEHGPSSTTMSDSSAQELPRTLDLAVKDDSDIDSMDRTIERRVTGATPSKLESPLDDDGVAEPHLAVLDQLYATAPSLDATLVNSRLDDFTKVDTIINDGLLRSTDSILDGDITLPKPTLAPTKRIDLSQLPSELDDDDATKEMPLPEGRKPPQRTPSKTPADPMLQDTDHRLQLTKVDVQKHFPDLARRKALFRILIAAALGVALLTALVITLMSVSANP